MGLFRRAATMATPSSRSLTADATRVDLSASMAKPGAAPGSSSGWQTEAWSRFDEIGELRAVCQWFANSLSRVRLVASEVDPNTGHPTGESDDQAANAMVRDIAGGPAGQAGMLARMATFLTVPGEVWVAIIDRDEGTDDEWVVLGDTEITTRGQAIEIALPDGGTHEIDPEVDSLFRVWRPHPRRASESDSPVRAALPILREIRRAEQTIEAAAKSRIAGNGVLALPQEISMPSGLAPTADPDAPGLPTPDGGTPVPAHDRVNADQIMAALQAAMTTAIQDQSSAAAMVPIVLQAQGDYIDKIKHITLDSDVNETALKTRESAIRRLALSLDIPPEILLGFGDSNHWNAWISQDTAISQHIAPMMMIVCDALTETVMRPLLRAHGHPDPDRVVVWFDLSDLSRRPDRREDAAAAFDRGVISAAAYRQELGYSEEDAPDLNSEEARRELAVQMASNAPSLFPLLAEVLGFDVPNTGPATGTGGAPPPHPGPPTPDTDPGGPS